MSEAETEDLLDLLRDAAVVLDEYVQQHGELVASDDLGGVCASSTLSEIKVRLARTALSTPKGEDTQRASEPPQHTENEDE